MDFFICYNPADKTWAEWIGWHLEEASYKVWLPDWDIHAGNNEVYAIQRAFEDAQAAGLERRMILVISPHFGGKSTQESVWTAISAKDPDGSKGLLIPVIIKETDLRSKIPSPTKSINLFQLDDETLAINQLLTGISGLRQKPISKPFFPNALSRANRDKPDYPGNLPGISPLPLLSVPEPKKLAGSNKNKRPDYQLGLLNRTSQRNHFLKHSNSNGFNAGQTLGFIVAGPRREWPEGLLFKLAHGLEVDLIRNPKRSPELIPLKADISMTRSEPADFLWELLVNAIGCEAEVANENAIRTTLEKLPECHIFFRKLKADEAKSHQFLAKMLSAWDGISLASHSKSHFLLFIHETEQESTLSFWKALFKRTVDWRQQMENFLKKHGLLEALLPELNAPVLSDITDWLNYHVEELLHDEIHSALKIAFPRTTVIPHGELKKTLLPILHKYHSKSELGQ